MINSDGKENLPMTVWVPILLLLILVEIWWFGAHCMAYLSDIRDLFKELNQSSVAGPSPE
jgi:hypothetical protein